MTMIKYPKLGYKISNNAMAVLKERYFFRDSKGKVIEEPNDMFLRVAKFISSAEKPSKRKKYQEEFYDLVASGNFMPNTPTLLNSGRGNDSVLSGCFVFEVEDKIYGGINSIFGSVALMALIHKMGGGTGCSFEKLRRQGEVVSSTGHMASGPVSFMRPFDEGIESIQQGGMRRGAHMSLLRVDHPDIEEFISCKNTLNHRTRIIIEKISKALNLDKGGEFYKSIELAIIDSQLTNMNISVSITKEFKEALKNDEGYWLIDPSTKKRIKKVQAKYIFDLIVKNAWASGEPGIIDLERINEDNPIHKLGFIYLVNPCGEQPLLPYECCNLGSISLPRMLKKEGKKVYIDYKKLCETINIAVRFLDNVIEVQSYPIPEIETATKNTRKIGLGYMGFADTCMLMGIEYGGEESLKLIDIIGKILKEQSFKASSLLGKEKGNFLGYKHSEYFENKIPMRNALRTTIAPTGSISGIAGVSFGIEPLYALSYTRTILDGKKFTEVSEIAKESLKIQGYWNKETERYIAENGHLKGLEDIPEDVKRIYHTAHNITPGIHLEVQARFQKYIDNAVSKTINLPSSATVKDVENIFKLAIEKKLKGVTIYRDESRQNQVLSTNKMVFNSIRKIRERVKELEGTTYKKEIGACGRMYITINTDENGYPFEIFINTGKSGGCLQAQTQAIGRLISIGFRAGLGIKEIVAQISGITCQEANPSISSETSFLSCVDSIARTIVEHFNKNKDVKITKTENLERRKTCEVCGAPLIYEGTCSTCTACFAQSCSGM